MRIAEIMTRHVRDIAPERSIREAARLMDELNVGVLPVCRGGRLVGVVTDRDITVRATAAGLPPDTTPVGDVMTEDTRSVGADDEVAVAVDLMTQLQVRRVPVLDAAGRLVGIVALGDLAEDRAPGAVEALAGISSPSEPDRSGSPSRRAVAGAAAAQDGPLTPEEREELARRRLAAAEQAGAARQLDDLAAPGLAANRTDATEARMIDRDEDLARAAFGTTGEEPGTADSSEGSQEDGAGGGAPFFHDDAGASSAEAGGYGREDAETFGIRTVAPRPRHVPPDANGNNPGGGLEPPAPSRQPDDR